MMPIPAARPDPCTNYCPPGPDATAEDTQRRLALAWASLAARRDPTGSARRVTVLPPFAF